eukprot:m.1036467 g.1036467  ORF g.1036467 m.1036467 type:complete len:68 (-) comp24139_c2_seq23:320-523(-)
MPITVLLLMLTVIIFIALAGVLVAGTWYLFLSEFKCGCVYNCVESALCRNNDAAIFVLDRAERHCPG